MKTVTDPFGYDISYTNDKTGRLTAVDGDTTTLNTTGHYADNIQYRAFGQIKRMDYVMPDGDAQIKLEYDSRLRVSHSEATQPGSTTNFLMKADHSYLADSRLAAKDDLLDNKWDRTMKYDFAGRLTFNQFGMGLGSDNQTMKRVYEQTIGYDKFSNMTTRSGVHWDNDISTGTMTYVNGRLQETSAEFDAAGNAVHTGNISVNPHDFSDTIYDASGRRMGSHTSVKGRWGSILNMVTETKEEMASDGDGRPVVEKRGTRYYHISNPPSGSLTATPYLFQVWSTVLGASLTSVLPNETKSSTSIYAGGALIAGEGVNGVGWKTADPVTGTVGSYMYYSTFTDASVVENEPLGQELHPWDPTDPPQPLPNEDGNNGADHPQWRCEEINARSLYGGFYAWPVECQKRVLQDLNNSIADLYGFSQKAEDPQRITKAATETPLPPRSSPDNGVTYAANVMRARALTATAKKEGTTNEPSSAGPNLHDIGEFTVNVFDDSIPDFDPAEFSGQHNVSMTKEEIADLEGKALTGITTACAAFIEKLAAAATGSNRDQRTGEPLTAKHILSEAFDRVKNSPRDLGGELRGFTWGWVQPGAGGQAGYGKIGGLNENVAQIQYRPGTKVTPLGIRHELIHVALRASDRQLSLIVKDLQIKVHTDWGKPMEYPTDKDNEKLAFSSYWGQALKNHCPDSVQ